jgi:hypothetical protein
MKWKVLVGVGAVLSLTGVVWILQGLNQLAGSPMTGVVFWAWAGLASLLAGLGFLGAAFRAGRKPPR